MEQKICKECEQNLFNSEFHKCKGGKLGTRSICKECTKRKRQGDSKEYYYKNKERLLNQKKEYYENRKEQIKEKNKKRYYENQIKYQTSARDRYHKSNPDHRRMIKNTYYHNKRKNNPCDKIRQNLSRRIRDFIKKDNITTQDLLGCSFEEFQKYLESLFLSGMNWENYGVHGWHIDHIIPCDSFDLSNSNQIKQCFHFSNLQPLWAKDNIKKSNKII
jgi:hypothetical protein